MFRSLWLASLLVSLSFASAQAEDFVLTIKDHTFTPAELTVPAGQKVKVLVKNLDATPEEFESHDLKREKVVKGNSEIAVNVGPLKAGTYKYVGEFNEDKAKGVIIAK